ncbi:MAG: hypothetical protein QM708_00985 [Propioniciclava sp.]
MSTHTHTSAYRDAAEQHSSHRLGWIRDPEHDISVPVTEIHLQDSPDGRPNAPFRAYRTMGPGSVPEEGLEPWRAAWVEARGDTETYQARGRRLEDDGRSAVRREAPSQQWQGRKPASRRAKPGRTATQMHYARQGIITPRCGSSRSGSSVTFSWCAPRSRPAGRSSPRT